MILKNDCILLLTELENNGIDVKEQLKQIIKSNDVPLPVLKFINDNRQFEANKFYEHIRKSYNQKKSQLYKNIVKEDIKDPFKCLTTLASLQLQILLYANKLDEKQMFLRHMRFEEISKVLLNYGKTQDLIPCQKLLKLVKADLKAFEYIQNT